MKNVDPVFKELAQLYDFEKELARFRLKSEASAPKLFPAETASVPRRQNRVSQSAAVRRGMATKST